MVAKKDRLPSEHVIAYLKYLLEAAGRVKDPGDDILTIFNKITNWKQGADERGNIRDLDQQEKFVTAALRNSGKNKVDVHNVKTLRAKMSEIQQDIGLSEDEVSIIIFTSLDHDWFNNLIVLAGEFTKWFSINFEGENREVILVKNLELFGCLKNHSRPFRYHSISAQSSVFPSE